jgi:cobalt/nickel transport system permease protein
MKNALRELYALDQLSGGNSCVHKLHPAVKLLTTVVFIITVVSFDRYAFGRLAPYIFYPALLAALSDTPHSMLLKRFLIAFPFCLFAGITNMLFDKTQAFALGGITISYGVVSFFSILFKTYLSVMAVFLLVSITPFMQITNSMRRLRMPSLFIIMFEMTYRYIGVLYEETYSMYAAYSLRSGGGKGIAMKDMGSFTGQLLLRSFDRADRIYNAMKCRGYAPGYALSPLPQERMKLRYQDIIFCFITCILCVVFRIINVNALFAQMFERLA